MKKVLFILMLLPYTLFSQDTIISNINDIKDIDLNNITLNKPISEATYNKDTLNFELSKDLTEYYVNIEKAYKKQLLLITTMQSQILNYYSLVKEMDIELTFKNKQIALYKDLDNIYDTKYGKIEKQLNFYKTAFNVSLSIDIASLFIVGSFMGGYYIANMWY